MKTKKENFTDSKPMELNPMLTDDYPPIAEGTRVITKQNIKGIVTGDYGHKVAVQYDGTNLDVVMHKCQTNVLVGG